MKIEIKELKKTYNGIPVLDVAALEIPAGAITAIVGPNGAGKSTLLNLLADLVPKDQGQVFYDGDSVPPLHKMTMVFQETYLISTTVRENILYPMKLRKFNPERMEQRIKQLSDELKLNALLPKRYNQLSMGEAQKVALARALAFEPKLLFLDEPSASIDPHTTSEIEKILLKLNREKGTTILIITHNLAQAKRLADHVILLNQGNVIESCSAQSFFLNPEKEETKRFIEGELLI